MMRMMSNRLLSLLVLTTTLAACRGSVSTAPPVHPVLNMDFQERFEPQERNPFFDDGRAMRPLVPGTIARGFLNEDSRLAYGKETDGTFVTTNPLPITPELLARGRERFDIYCAPCHGKAGDGQGIISTGNYGMVPAPTYHDDRLRSIEDGYLFDVAANGIRTMPGYGYQVRVEERWAIVAYIRALQRSQDADAADVPAEVRGELQPGEGQ